MRKPIDELTVEDLDVYPVWEFATDEEDIEGQDETWVRPLRTSTIEEGAGGLSVAADFVTASGKELEGFVSVSFVRGFMSHAGAILSGGKYLYVSSLLSLSEQEYVAERVGVPAGELFPLSWSLRVQVVGEAQPRRGEFLP